MKLIKYILIAVLTMGYASQVSAKSKPVKAYLFGFAASFNDSTVYFTGIQEVNGAYMQEKSKFLVNRDEYSHQLRNYLKAQGNNYPTCVTSYAYDLKHAQKEYDKMRKKYTVKAKNRFIVVDIKETEFKYEAVTPDNDDMDDADWKASRKAKKAELKAARKAAKDKKPKGGHMGPPPMGGGMPGGQR